MYENAPDMGGWSLTRKRKEMTVPEGRFLVLSSPTGPSAFLFFQFLMEDSCEEEEVVPVLYVLELAVEKACQGRGLGRRLMQYAETIALDRGMEKVVLTVFKENLAARKFYKALGYSPDEISADEDDTEASVLILSKNMRRL